MNNLQEHIQNYLEAADYRILNKRDKLLVVDRLSFGGDRDTRLIWISPPSTKVSDFSKLEKEFLEEFESLIPQYPEAKYSLVAHTLEGFSRDFRNKTIKLRVKMSVPVQFFDAPFKVEDAPEVGSVIKTLRDPNFFSQRISQPYRQIANGKDVKKGEDLFINLYKEIKENKGPVLRIVIGPAGAGKTVLFRNLFARLYDEFIINKKKHSIFPRPIPLMPEYLHHTSSYRINELIRNFIYTDVAAPINLPTFEWMLTHGQLIWLFDGLDELYAGDQDFFDHILDILTRKDSTAQIIIWARESLITSCKTFADFLSEFHSYPGEMVQVYKLDNWNYNSKRNYAWLCLEEKLPSKKEVKDPPKVSEFLRKINISDSLKSLSGLPFYCKVLMDEFKESRQIDFVNDFELISQVISEMIKREIQKGILKLEQFENQGLNEWLETVALELYENNFKGLKKEKIEIYAQSVLRSEIENEEKNNTITTLIQFPLFAPGANSGIITFEHEILGEYLAGNELLKQIIQKPSSVAYSLGNKIDFSESFIARYMAYQLMGNSEGINKIIKSLKFDTLNRRAFANLLQLLLLIDPSANIIRDNKIILECRDLKYVQFKNRNLEEISFRNSDLSNTIFRSCNLKNSQFEGANLSGTRFENLNKDALLDARFGDLKHFEYIYYGKQKIDSYNEVIGWIEKSTGRSDKIQEPCAAALQLRTLFMKFICQDGRGRRDYLLESALNRGKRFPGAPNPKECIDACIRFGYLNGPDHRKKIKRATGDKYNEMVNFVKSWNLSNDIRHLINSLCSNKDCEHIPSLSVVNSLQEIFY